MKYKSATPALHALVTPLTLAGAFPFVGCAIAAWRLWPMPFDPAYAAAVYAAVILSFLGGIQWGTFLNGSTPKSWVIVTSNLLALQGWASVLVFASAPSGTCIGLGVGFLIALWVDSRLYRQGFLSKDFYKLRQLITTIVVTCLVVTAAAIHFAIAARAI